MQCAGPVVSAVEAGERRMDLAVVAGEAADAAEQVGKARQVPGLLDVAAAHHRRKPQHLGAGLAVPRDQRREPFDHRLEQRRAAVNAGTAGLREQRTAEHIEPVFGQSLARACDGKCIGDLG